MGVFATGGIGLDPGSANITIALQNEGIVLREPSYVLCEREDTSSIHAVGRKARQMLGRTSDDMLLLSPILEGAVSDVTSAATLMRALADKALGRNRALEKNRLVVSCSTGCTHVELQALKDVIRATGAKKAAILRTPIAAALGAGVPISDPSGCMIIVIGSATTEISVLTMNGIAATRAMRTGSLSIDEAIMRYVRREKGIIIGQRTAEDLKIDMGSVREEKDISDETATLRGRDPKTGKPATAQITAKELRNAIARPLDDLLDGIRDAFENTPADMAEDIMAHGVTLCGGGAQLDGLAEALSIKLELNVTVSENPSDDVALGCCMVASDDHLAQRYAASLCLTEV